MGLGQKVMMDGQQMCHHTYLMLKTAWGAGVSESQGKTTIKHWANAKMIYVLQDQRQDSIQYDWWGYQKAEIENIK